MSKLVPFHFEKDKTKKAELKKEVEEHLPKYWSIFEKRIQANSGNWIYGNSVTYIDISVVAALDYVLKAFPNFLDSYPGVSKLKESVETLPNIAKWIKNRPETPF